MTSLPGLLWLSELISRRHIPHPQRYCQTMTRVPDAKDCPAYVKSCLISGHGQVVQLWYSRSSACLLYYFISSENTAKLHLVRKVRENVREGNGVPTRARLLTCCRHAWHTAEATQRWERGHKSVRSLQALYYCSQYLHLAVFILLFSLYVRLG